MLFRSTLITARSLTEVGALVRAHPEIDFLVPDRYQSALEGAPQDVVRASPAYLLALSKMAVARAVPAAWSCKM